MLICQKSRSKLSIGLQTNITTDDPEASFVWSDRLEHDFIGKPVLDLYSKVTQPNADLELSSAFTYRWVVTGVRDDDANFPCFCFSVRDLIQHNSIAYTHHYMCNLKIVSQQVQTWQKPLGCVAVGCVASWRCEAKVLWIGNLCGRVRSQRHSNHFMPTLETNLTDPCHLGVSKHILTIALTPLTTYIFSTRKTQWNVRKGREKISQKWCQSSEFCQYVTAAVQASKRTTDA